MRKLKIFLLLFLVMQIAVFGGERVYASTKVITYINNVVDIPAVAVEVLGSSDSIVKEVADVSFNAFDADGRALQLPVKWNFSTVNLGTAGAYRLQGIAQIPEGYVLAGNVNLPAIQVPVSVQRKGVPDINVCYKDSSSVQKVFVFPWVSYEYPENMKVWLRKSGEKWKNITGTGLAVCNKEGLKLAEQALTVGNTYSMVVSYGNQMTKTLKFSYGMDKVLNKISYQNEFVGNATNPAQCISSFDEEFLRYADRYYAEALPVGANLRELVEKLRGKAIFSVSTMESFEDTEENPAIELEALWDLSLVDVESPGVYKIIGKYTIPEGYSIKKELELPTVNVYVSVQEEGIPQIRTCYQAEEDVLCFPVLFRGLTQEQQKTMRVYLKKFGGEFTDVTGKGAYIESDGIYLDMTKYIQNNSSYEIYAEYEGGCTEVYGFTYKDSSIINEMSYDMNAEQEDPNEDSEEDLDEEEGEGSDAEDTENMEDEGSEDMSDLEDSESEDLEGSYSGSGYSTYSYYSSGDSGSSSSDSAESVSAASTVVTVSENETDTSTIMDGKSLNAMIDEDGNYITFEKQGISVQLSEAVVKSWGIGEGDSFKISIQMISDKGFSVRVFAKDEEKKEIPGTTVKLPMKEFMGISAPAEVEVSDIDGNICSSTYDEKKGILEVSLSKSGDYFMDDGQENTEEEEFLDDDQMSGENEDDVPMDEEFWEDEELFAADEFGEDMDVYDEEFWEDGEVFVEDGFSEGEEAFMDEGDLYDGEVLDGEKQETEDKWYLKLMTRVLGVLEEMKENRTLIPAAVAVGAALILLVLFAGGKKKK